MKRIYGILFCVMAGISIVAFGEEKKGGVAPAWHKVPLSDEELMGVEKSPWMHTDGKKWQLQNGTFRCTIMPLTAHIHGKTNQEVYIWVEDNEVLVPDDKTGESFALNCMPFLGLLPDTKLAQNIRDYYNDAE